jgi:hypothetical protein
VIASTWPTTLPPPSPLLPTPICSTPNVGVAQRAIRNAAGSSLVRPRSGSRMSFTSAEAELFGDPDRVDMAAANTAPSTTPTGQDPADESDIACRPPARSHVEAMAVLAHITPLEAPIVYLAFAVGLVLGIAGTVAAMRLKARARS